MSTKPWEHAQHGGSGGDALAARFVASLDYDRRLYKHDIAGSIAHARMLAHVQLITAQELTAIERGLNEIKVQIERDGDAWAGWKIELEDVHMCVEAALIENIGEPGRKLHTGRSRNDQVALDLKLWIEDAADAVQARLDALVHAFVIVADAQGRTVMPSYTHLQRAQPIVLGGELLAWAEAFSRCGRRLTSLRSIIPRNPLGSGAIAGSSLPLDREHLAAQLPLGAPTANSIDATASRDAALDFVFALSMTALWLSRWAEQWVLYVSTEFSFLKLDSRYTTGSSMMPQKQNPDMLELIRGRCGGVYGQLTALLVMCKGLTIGYNRDLQEDKRHVFAAFDTVNDMLDMAARIVATATFQPQNIEKTLERGFLDATSLAEYLVSKGIAFRTAHQVVGALVRTCTDTGRHKLGDLSVDEMNTALRSNPHVAGDIAIDADVYGWLGAGNVVQRYRTAGNAGLTGFEDQLKQWRQRLG
jgi:argininosuccinate lyase